LTIVFTAYDDEFDFLLLSERTKAQYSYDSALRKLLHITRKPFDIHAMVEVNGKDYPTTDHIAKYSEKEKERNQTGQ